jgi:tryptophanyl-tRNA synthetase
MTNKKPISLTGIQPSGTIHLGNYLGAIKPAILRQDTYSCIYFIADLHALTTVRDAKIIKTAMYDLVATWVTCGLDYEKHILFKQSDVPIVTELAWYLGCVTGLGFIEKAHAAKDAKEKNKEISFGTFAYPVLMAADILLYDADIVPVGKDQKQHVEMARDMAGSFNHAYKADIIKLPEPKIEEQTMIVPGLDGRKMSKSYGNIIPLFSSEKELRKKVLSIATDSTPLEDPKTMEGTLLGKIFQALATKEEYADLEKRLQKGGLGWGHAKEELAQIIHKQVGHLYEPYLELRKNEKKLDEILALGAKKANTIAQNVIDKVRVAVGTR